MILTEGEARGMKYLCDGRAVEVIQRLNDGSFLVARMYDDNGESYVDVNNAEIAKEVFDTPPLGILHASIGRLHDQIQQLTKRREDLLAEVSSIEKTSEERKKRYSQSEQLRLLDDYIAGKITHYTVLDSWDGPRIVEFRDASSDGDRKSLKLLTLFGNSDGNLLWRLNQYRDGSGGYDTVYPATSLEDAQSVAKKYVSEQLEETKGSPSIRVMEWAKKWGVPVPEEYSSTIREKQIETQRDIISRRSGEVEVARETIIALGGKP